MRRTNPHTIIKPTDWAALRDALVLALDSIGERPDEMDDLSLVHAVRAQRAALKITHRYFQAQ